MKLSLGHYGPAYTGIRTVPAGCIGFWLQSGWNDLRANPLPGLAYGLLFSITGDLILLATLGQVHLFTVALSGFFLLAPLLAAGLYELSRQKAAGTQPTFIDSLSVFWRNRESFALLGVVLVLLAIIWERTSAILFALLGNGSALDFLQFLDQVGNGEHLHLVGAWFLCGGLLALLTFAISVVAVPMMIDRDTDFVSAMQTSVRVCIANSRVMLLWAAVIVGLTIIGFATLLLGLVIIMPILGHASWHAYRDLVE